MADIMSLYPIGLGLNIIDIPSQPHYHDMRTSNRSHVDQQQNIHYSNHYSTISTSTLIDEHDVKPLLPPISNLLETRHNNNDKCTTNDYNLLFFTFFFNIL